MNKILSSLNFLNITFKDRGMQALVVTNVMGNVIRLLSSLLLARLLSPEAFAITGLAATVIFAFNMVSDGGFRAFILRHQDGDSDRVLHTLWTAKLVRNLILAVLMYAFSSVIANFFGISELSTVLEVLSLVFIADGLVPIGYIAIERQNRVATVMYVRFACTILSTVFMIVGVYFIRNYWPIIYSMILNYVFQIVLGYIFIGGKGSRIGINKEILFELFGWVKYIIPSSLITLFLMQFDKVILGKVLSLDELGLYFVAFNFASAAATFTIEYARGVLLPYMSIIYRDSVDLYVDKYYSKRLKLSVLLAFLLGGFSGGSFVFFDLLYDDRYLTASYYLSILLITPILTLVTYPSEATLILFGQIKTTLIANIIRLIWFFTGAWFGYQWFGVSGLLIAIVSVEIFPALYMLLRLKMLKSVRLLKECYILAAAAVGFFLTRSIVAMF